MAREAGRCGTVHARCPTVVVPVALLPDGCGDAAPPDELWVPGRPLRNRVRPLRCTLRRRTEVGHHQTRTRPRPRRSGRSGSRRSRPDSRTEVHRGHCVPMEDPEASRRRERPPRVDAGPFSNHPLETARHERAATARDTLRPVPIGVDPVGARGDGPSSSRSVTSVAWYIPRGTSRATGPRGPQSKAQ